MHAAAYARHVTRHPPYTAEQEQVASREIRRLRDAAWTAVLLAHDPAHVVDAFTFDRKRGCDRGAKPEQDAVTAFTLVKASPAWSALESLCSPASASSPLLISGRPSAARDLAPVVSACDPDLLALARATGRSTPEWFRLMHAVQQFEARNIGLCYHLARRFWRVGVGFTVDDLAAFGFEGLHTAVLRFDPDLGHRFSTYASGWIRHRVGRALDDLSRTIRLPVHVIETTAKAARIREQAALLGLPRPTDEEVAQRIGVSASKVARCVQLCASQPASLEATLGGREEGSDTSRLGEFMADDSPIADEAVAHEEAKEMVREALAGLPRRQRDVLLRRFGEDEETLQSLSQDLGVSRERVRQIQGQALDDLRCAVVRRRRGSAAARLSQQHVTC